MNKNLYDAGYFNGRKADINEFIQNIEEQGLPMVDTAMHFLEKYANIYPLYSDDMKPKDYLEIVAESKRFNLNIRNRYSNQSYTFGIGSKAIALNALNSIQESCSENATQIGCVSARIAGTVSIFITESGKFYLERGNKIADSEEEFWDYVFSPNEQLEVIIDPKIFDILRKAGWYEGRKIDSSKYIERLKKGGYTEIFKPAVAFYEEFGELKVLEEDPNNEICTCLNEISDFDFNVIRNERLREKFEVELNIIASCAYSVVFVSENGEVYSDNDGMCVKSGANFIEFWNTVLRIY